MSHKYLKFIAGLFVSVSALHTHAQQSFTYTQYMNNLTPYNPAFSLVAGQGTVNLLGRKQLTGIDGAPTSFVLNGSAPIKSINDAAGLVVIQDKFGVEDQTEFSAFLAKSVALSPGVNLGLSLSAGIRQFKATYSSLDAADPQFKNDINESTPLAGAGLILYQPGQFYVSLSMPAFSLKNDPLRKLKNTSYFGGAYIAQASPRLSIKPATLLSYTPGLPVLADVSATFYLDKRVGAGLNFRSTKEIGGILSFEIDTNFSVAYSYQAGTGNTTVSTFQNATHEFSVGFHFGKAPANRTGPFPE